MFAGAGVPNYQLYRTTNINNQANVKVTHGMALKQQNDAVKMNTTIINVFHDLVPVAFIQSNELIWLENPNSSEFHKMFNWFVMKYERTSAKDRKTNPIVMAMEWHPRMGFKMLITRLFRGATFTNLAKHTIPDKDKDIADIGIRIIHRHWPLH